MLEMKPHNSNLWCLATQKANLAVKDLDKEAGEKLKTCQLSKAGSTGRIIIVDEF